MMARIQRILGPAAVALAACSWLAGCSDEPVGTAAGEPAPDATMQQIDLNQRYGGLAYTDEPAAFGDAGLQAEARAEMSAPAAQDDDEQSLAARYADVEGLLARGDLRRTYLRIVWGRLEGERDTLDATAALVDWTGGLSVSDGALVVKRTLLFERLLQGDHLLPRDSRQAVEWVSHTGGHVDGIVVCVLSVPDSSGALAGALTFQTPQLTHTIELASLEGLDQTIATDELGNGVHFTALTRAPIDCPSGFMAGRWLIAPGEAGGIFQGLWLTESGRVRGFVRGRFGTNDAGDHVFAGKLIALDGRIRGLCEGTFSPNGDGTGSYQGHWANQAGTRLGEMGGKYMSRPAPSPDRPAMGFFQGRWRELCAEPSPL